MVCQPANRRINSFSCYNSYFRRKYLTSGNKVTENKKERHYSPYLAKTEKAVFNPLPGTIGIYPPVEMGKSPLYDYHGGRLVRPDRHRRRFS